MWYTYDMKKFSERINADWYTTERLEELLNEFFDDDSEPKTLTHLYCWLNIDWIEFLSRQLDPRFASLLTAAENYCEKWVVDHGFANDKSFGRWYLANYHAKSDNEDKNNTENTPTINIVMDNGKS